MIDQSFIEGLRYGGWKRGWRGCPKELLMDRSDQKCLAKSHWVSYLTDPRLSSKEETKFPPIDGAKGSDPHIQPKGCEVFDFERPRPRILIRSASPCDLPKLNHAIRVSVCGEDAEMSQFQIRTGKTLSKFSCFPGAIPQSQRLGSSLVYCPRLHQLSVKFPLYTRVMSRVSQAHSHYPASPHLRMICTRVDMSFLGLSV